MPGNEVGDRVHNFLTQEDLSQGQHSHAVGGNWPSDSGLWVSNQKPNGSPSSITKAYGPQQSEIVLRHSSQRFRVPNGYNVMQTTERPEFPNYQSQIQHQNLNCYAYGGHLLQTRPGETDILGLDTETDRDNMNHRGFLVSEQISNSHRSNEYDGLNLFGGQHQMNGQHPGLMQPLQQQQSGFGDLQHLQQQLMLKRMQELQRQKNMQQVDTRQHNLVNQVSPFARQASENRSHGVVNPAHMGFTHQQFDQSLYGFPVSSSMGPLNPYPFGADKDLTRQMPVYGSSVPGNQYHIPVQGSNSWISGEQIQQMKPIHQSGSDPVYQGPQDLMSHSEMPPDEPAMGSLDPEEEKILFGSDENIWEAFGSDRPSDLLDDNEFASGLPSIQSGSWSALMQSAVTETTSSGKGLQEDLAGLSSQNLQHPSGRHLSNDENDNSLQQFQSNNTTRVIHEEIGHGGGIWRVNAHPNSNVDLGPTSTSMGSPQFNEGHAVNSAAATPNLSNMQGSTQFGQLPSNSHQLNYWKHVEASVKSQHNLNQISESSFNSSDKEDVKMHEIQSQNKRENSNDSYQSTSSRQLISETGDLRAQSGRLTSGQRKFQYHPMGNLDEDVEMSYGKIQGTAANAMSLQHFRGLRGQSQENLGHAKFGGQVPKIGQNMLELLHKVDQSRDGGTARNLNSSELNLSSETPEPDYSDGSVGGLQRTQSSNSQGFGLHLGPPSQRLSLRDNASNLLSRPHISSNLRDRGQSVLPYSYIQETPHAGLENPNIGTLSAVFSNAKSQLQNHHMITSGSQLDIVESTSAEQKAEKRETVFPNTGTSSLNSQGLASVVEQSRKGSFPLNVLSSKVDQGRMMNGPLGKESVIDVLPVHPTTRQINLEAFGHSLKTNDLHQNISLMNQMSAMRNLDHDPCNRVAKRLKQSDSFLDVQSESQTSLSSNIMTSVKAEHSHISPQMAPSWFDRYGTFKNDQSAEIVGRVKSIDQPYNVDRIPGGLKTHGQVSSAVDASQIAAISKNFVPSSVEFEQTTLLPTNAGIQNLVTLRPKKQILTGVDLHPWLVEVSGRFKNLKGICTGAVEWSRAANRLMEKIDDDGDLIEDTLPIAKPKRRLIVTSLLMQQLLRPPPATILSLDTCSNYESVVYYVARLALGDACNLVSSSRSYPCIPLDGANCLSDKSEQSEIIDDRHRSKVIENFTSKARKLEDDFLRLDKRASILDLRVEYEDLERFSVFNRFARFHGRGQSDVAETSSSDAPAPAASKPFPQRYVTAVQMPPNLPDRVQCLSL